jgi:pimeloyl-ACP methyl ester carboxylesterase
VGHSLGGVLSTIYASKYPERVKGVVLLDPPYPGRYSCGVNVRPVLSPWVQFFRMTCAWGSMRILYSLGYFESDITGVLDQLPDNVSSIYQQKLFKCKMFEAMHRESIMWPTTCFQAPVTLVNVPALVFIAGKGLNNTEWGNISNSTRLIEYPLADHYFHVNNHYYGNITDEILAKFVA